MRILLGIVLALSVSFACDQPYEEVGGYKIGCYLNPAKMPYDKMVKDENMRVLSNDLPKDSFFKKVTTTLLNGNIEQIEFTQSYSNYVELSEDMLVLLDTMKKKWGEYIEINPKEKSAVIVSDKSNDNNYLFEITQISPRDNYNIYLFDNIDNPVIQNIIVSESVDSEIGVISVIYISKKIQIYRQELLIESVADKTKKLENF